ncbi:hypothetical protein niasHT_018143 [Heterodera trifolii]|uniref:C3H1-type domain-containing protein n=1 Tax=Heterodera trifolii TaxID=157864 RepID=A0ABD2LLG9_9BILA
MAPLSSAVADCEPTEQLFETVSVAEVNCENLNVIWPYLIESIRKAQLVSIDLELSGLGDRAGSMRTMPERYKRTREAAQTRSILSVGIATFQFDGIDTEQRALRYKCRVFDMLALEEKPFVVEPEALRFLSSHGFDFNRLLTHGIRYSKTDSSGGIFHSLWEELLASGVCIAFHNGLTDLAFLHEHFYAPLPEQCDQFTANLADWFGKRETIDDYYAIDCALWDSKYMAEHQQTKNFSCSYLDYVFRKAQRENQKLFQNKKPHLVIKFSKLRSKARNATKFSHLKCGLKESFVNGKLADIRQEMLCQSYTRFGHCRNRTDCAKEHDVDLLLDLEDKRTQLKREKERKRRSKKETEKQTEESDGENTQRGEEEEEEILEEQENERGKEGGTKRKWDGSKESEQFFAKSDDRIGKTMKKSKENYKNGEGIGPSSVDTLTKINRTVHIWTTSRGCHRAGMDAFMTGFAVLFFQLDHVYRNSCRFDLRLAGCVALAGKELPLLIRKSNFITQTESHQLNWARVDSRRKAFDRAKYSLWTRGARGKDSDGLPQ